MRYVISKKWTDSTGKYQVEKICECDDLEHAKFVHAEIAKSSTEILYEIDEYGKQENVIICVDHEQIEVAWECQKWLQERGVRPIVCFSMVDFNQIKEMYVGYGIPHMVALVAKNLDAWKDLDYDLKTSEFDHDDFETILSVME
jgi:hypothetical protein